MRLRNLCAMAAAIVAMLGLSTDVHASVLGVAGEFNGFIFGNLSAEGGDTEGRLAVGGDFFAKWYAVGSGGIGPASPLTNPPTDNLVVGGDLNAEGKWQVFNGNAVYGDALIAAPTTPNGVTKQGTPVDFAAAQTDLVAKSAFWSTLTPNGTSVYQWSTLTLTGLDPTLNIFNVLESDWESSSNKVINVPVGSTVLVNIAGINVTQTGGLQINGSSNQNNAMNGSVLYNYYQATSVTHSGMALLGSLLAPNAHLSLSGGGINGNGIAASATTFGGGEFHNFAFTGNLPTPDPNPNPEPTSTPEPSSAVIGVALCAMGTFVARRRLFA